MEKFFSFVILLVAATLLTPGCFAAEVNESANAPAPVVTEVTEKVNATDVAPVETGESVNTTYIADANTTNLSMKVDETALISLKENPTTGYSWNVSNSTGLEIVNDTYTMDKVKSEMVGVGGIHEWVIKAVEAGNQTFSAVMMHVSEPAKGDEETYTLNVTVE